MSPLPKRDDAYGVARVREGARGRGYAPVTDAPPAIELRGIDKRFGPVHANRSISLSVPAGTIHGIVGENGAGKSTLMSILYGYYQADAGEIWIKGQRRDIRTTADAIAAGIGMVHQHFMLVDTFTVLENVVLGVEGGPLLRQGMERARAELKRLEREYKLEVDIDAVVGGLAVGLRSWLALIDSILDPRVRRAGFSIPFWAGWPNISKNR